MYYMMIRDLSEMFMTEYSSFFFISLDIFYFGLRIQSVFSLSKTTIIYNCLLSYGTIVLK